MATHSSTLALKILWMEEPGRLQSMGSLGVRQDFTFTFTFQFHALEKEMATHFSVLAWRIPGTAEPGGLPSMRSHRVGHNWSDLAAAAAAEAWKILLNPHFLHKAFPTSRVLTSFRSRTGAKVVPRPLLCAQLLHLYSSQDSALMRSFLITFHLFFPFYHLGPLKGVGHSNVSLL